MTIAVLALSLATSTGFRVPDGPSGPPEAVCATNLPHLRGLYCASPLIKPHTYDGLGVLRLGPTGTVTTIQGGNDLLLAIEGAGDHTRPILSPGHSWSANGYHCARTTTAVRCRPETHGFSITLGLLVSTSLHITVWPNGRGHAPLRTYTLTCVPLGGTLPQRALACQKLVQMKAPFAPVPAGTPCTQIYGGPQEARVTGRFRGEPVYAHFDRNGGCEIARWNRVGFLFPAA